MPDDSPRIDVWMKIPEGGGKSGWSRITRPEGITVTEAKTLKATIAFPLSFQPHNEGQEQVRRP